MNEDPVNLLYEFKDNLYKNPEDEFVSITNVFSNLLDNWVDDSSFTIKEDNDIENSDNYINKNIFKKNRLTSIEQMHISNKYKVLFCCHKMVAGKSTISLFNLRTNAFIGIFCKIKGIIRCSEVNDQRNTLLIITLEPENKKTQLEVWKYEENSCPVGTYDFSNLINYSFTINSFYVKSVPEIFNNIMIDEEINNNIIEIKEENKIIKEKTEKDIITLGTSKGDIIIGEISISPFNHQPNFKHIITYKLHKNEDLEIEDVSNKYEISFIAYDFSNLINYSFTINSFFVKSVPEIFNNIIVDEESNNKIEMNNENKLIKEKIYKDIIVLGTSKGDIIIGEISISPFNNQPNFKHIMTYKLHKNENLEIEDVSNKYEISFIAYDFNFDMVYFGDLSSNVKFIEKVLQLGKSYVKQDNFPLFSFDYENNSFENKDKKKKKRNEFLKELDSQTNYDLPYLSMSHDIIKDRNIILYDKGSNVNIQNIHNYDKNNKEIDLDIDSDFDDLDADNEYKIHNNI